MVAFALVAAALVSPRSFKTAVALANKIARIAWVLMARGGAYHEPVPQAA